MRLSKPSILAAAALVAALLAGSLVWAWSKFVFGISLPYLAGLAAAVAFRMNLFNIGAEGQLYAGALAAIAVGGVPAGATPVERRAVYETAVQAGARKVYMNEEPVAASLGAGLPIDAPTAFMVVDIGGGTTDLMIMTYGVENGGTALRRAGGRSKPREVPEWMPLSAGSFIGGDPRP